MIYKTDAYLITCLTNMHAGSGDSNYGVIDNLVQRDPLNEIPIVNSSSLKGALREFFKDKWGENDDKLNWVFGPDPSRNSSSQSNIGNYRFFEATLLVLPVRSNLKPFFRGTAKFLLEDINLKAKALGLDKFNIDPMNGTDVTKESAVVETGNSCNIEDVNAIDGLTINTNIKNNLGENIALFHTDDFKELSKRLPVIARNQLVNGESKNLWYEEVVPRESRFVFFVSKTDQYADDFDKAFKDKLIQIGANASIGYGFTNIQKIS